MGSAEPTIMARSNKSTAKSIGLSMIKRLTRRAKDDQNNPMQKWLLNVIVPIVTIFGIFNLAVSGEAVENFAKALRLRKQVTNYASINITEAIQQAALAAAQAAKNEAHEEEEA